MTCSQRDRLLGVVEAHRRLLTNQRQEAKNPRPHGWGICSAVRGGKSIEQPNVFNFVVLSQACGVLHLALLACPAL